MSSQKPSFTITKPGNILNRRQAASNDSVQPVVKAKNADVDVASSIKPSFTITKPGNIRKRRHPAFNNSVQQVVKTKNVSGYTKYNLRSKDAVKKIKTSVELESQSINFLKFPATVTPASIGRRRPVKQNYIQSNLFATSIPVPRGVIDIFARRICMQGKQCICPVHWRHSVWTLDSSLDLALFHVNHYGLDYATLLFEQEKREQADVSSLYHKEKLAVQNTLATFSPYADGNMQSDYSSQSDGDTTSDPCTPRPGTKLKYSLNETMTPVNLLFSSVPDSEPLCCQPNITPKMRGILVNWLVEVSMEYKVSEEAFHLSISILDATLARGKAQNESQTVTSYEINDDSDATEDSTRETGIIIRRAEFQAVGCACLWIASKVQDKCSPTAEDFVYISDYSFTAEKLIYFESRICKQLEFRIFRVTPFNFLNNFLKASYACDSGSHCQYDHAVLRLLSTYLLELSRISCDLVVTKPSLIAAAALYLARATLGIRETNISHCADSCYWTKTLIHYTGYSATELIETALIINQHHLAAETGETTKAMFLKYKKSCCLGVSLKTVPRFDSLQLPDAFAHFSDTSSSSV